MNNLCKLIEDLSNLTAIS